MPLVQQAQVTMALLENKPDAALTIARKVQAQRPDDATGYSMEGDVELRRKNWDAAAAALAAPPPTDPPADLQRVRRATRHFDRCGRLIRWPGRTGERYLCLWVLWSRLPPGALRLEARVNGDLAHWHTFGDHALLRRDWFDAGLVDRTPDGRSYRRMERRPPPEARALIGHVRTLRGGAPVAPVTSAPAPAAPAA
jgi:hypothetical protein